MCIDKTPHVIQSSNGFSKFDEKKYIKMNDSREEGEKVCATLG